MVNLMQAKAMKSDKLITVPGTTMSEDDDSNMRQIAALVRYLGFEVWLTTDGRGEAEPAIYCSVPAESAEERAGFLQQRLNELGVPTDDCVRYEITLGSDRANVLLVGIDDGFLEACGVCVAEVKDQESRRG